jgi:hypothetical protein
VARRFILVVIIPNSEGVTTMANPLTFIMPLAADADVEQLMTALGSQSGAIDGALAQIGTVHFARFVLFDTAAPNLLPTPGSKGPFGLSVITDYDGDFDIYIQAFVSILGPVFDELLKFSSDGADLIPVKDHVTEFEAYIKANDASQQPPNNAFSLYSAYPYTVQQILANPPA